MRTTSLQRKGKLETDTITIFCIVGLNLILQERLILSSGLLRAVYGDDAKELVTYQLLNFTAKLFF